MRMYTCVCRSRSRRLTIPDTIIKTKCQAFHALYKGLCDAAGAGPCEAGGLGLYAEFKKTCDDYFYLPARKEHRSVSFACTTVGLVVCTTVGFWDGRPVTSWLTWQSTPTHKQRRGRYLLRRPRAAGLPGGGRRRGDGRAAGQGLHGGGGARVHAELRPECVALALALACGGGSCLLGGWGCGALGRVID